jgi:hypothetical protein
MNRNRLRWCLLLVCRALGLAFLNWALANTSFSVPADPAMAVFYKTRAILGFDLAVACLVAGAITFIALKTRRLTSAQERK